MSVLLDPVRWHEMPDLDGLVPYLMDAVLTSRCAGRHPGFLCAEGVALGALPLLPRCILGHPQVESSCVMGSASSLGGLR